MSDMASPPGRVQVLETIRVTPSSDSSESAHQFSLPLSYFDTILFKFPPVERIFFYQLNDLTLEFFNSETVPKLKHSLALTLFHYLPLAGNLRWPSDSPKPIIIYNPNDEVWVTVAVSNSNFSVVSGNEAHEALELHSLVPKLLASDDLAPIIALQITLFPSQGFCIGITAHHTVLDGKSTTMFMKSWAHICKQVSAADQNSPNLPPELTPFYDRSVIKDPTGLDLLYLNQLLDLTTSDSYPNRRSLMIIQNFRDFPDDLVRATFVLTRKDINKLKEKVLSKLVHKEKPLHLSSFVVTLAYVSTCQIKARGGEGDRNVLLGFPADVRRLLNPPIPEKYFGNCVLGPSCVKKARNFMDENGFVYATELVSDMIKDLEGFLGSEPENRLIKFLGMFKETGRQFISVSGSPQFGVYGVDFGWGKPTKVEIVSIDRGGAIAMAESRDGDGGIEIGLALNKHEMETFTSLFISTKE